MVKSAILKGDEYSQQDGDIRFRYDNERPVIEELLDGTWIKVNFQEEEGVIAFMRQRFGIVDDRFKKKQFMTRR